jgi:hypothetical protein
MRATEVDPNHRGFILGSLLWMFLAALLLTAFFWSLLAHAGPLCDGRYPVRRVPDVTYGGLPPRHGFERDHRLPLCLGGPDVPEQCLVRTLSSGGPEGQTGVGGVRGYVLRGNDA